jgi:GDP-D-mannose dehydratase
MSETILITRQDRSYLAKLMLERGDRLVGGVRRTSRGGSPSSTFWATSN